MCGFSRSVLRVANTQIFARAVSPTRQALVYSMSVAAREDLAMVLPLPVPARSAEDAVQFVSLEAYPHFFHDLARAFPAPARGRRNGAKRGAMRGGARTPLAVVDVGMYEASFVPSIADFDRLDLRFALPPATWNKLAGYRDWGFAVFKLRGFSPTAGALDPRGLPTTAARQQTFHPMALTFPRRDPARLFFPTVHVHDGVVHRTARFDHALYLQEDRAGVTRPRWRRSARAARYYVRDASAAGLVEPTRTLRRRTLRGERLNRDVWLDAAG